MSQGIERASMSDEPALKSKTFEDGSDSSQHFMRAGPKASVHRLSKSLRAKIHRRSRNYPNDQRVSDKTILAPTLAPNPSVATKEDRFEGQPPAKPNLPPLKEVLQHPVQAIKSVAHIEGGGGVAETLATKDISHEAGVQLVRADEEIAIARTESQEDLALEKLESLKSVRQDSYVRWTLDRHIGKVGSVQQYSVTWKNKAEFLRQGENGKQETDWEKYGHHVWSPTFLHSQGILHCLAPFHITDRCRVTLLTESQHKLFLFYLHEYGGHYIGASSDLPEPTEASLISSFERILLTSTPVQNAFMMLRRVSRWENPWESGTYMVLYFFLLIFSYITRAFLLLALYTVVKRRYFPPTIAELRKDLKLAEDKEAEAQDISQLIDQHGAHGWVDPLIEKAGPTALLHLEDLANFMEMLRNFYEWRDPTRTAITLGWLCLLWVMVTLTPVSILVKESFFAVGFMFFGLAPIAARYPQYRLILSPLIWLFWRIPTHAEWAIARLQTEATRQLKTMRERNSFIKTSSPGDSRAHQLLCVQGEDERTTPLRIGRYHCTSKKRHGNLCVSTDRVSFETHLTASEGWSLNYKDLKSIEKATGSSIIKSGDGLLFADMSGNEYVASGLKLRDVVFSQIVGYSNVRWQRMR